MYWVFKRGDKVKLIIPIIVLLLLVGFSSAYYDGQVLTQQQINNINTDLITWKTLEANITNHRVYTINWSNIKYYQTEVSMYTIYYINNSYILKYRPYRFNSPIYIWREMIQEHNRTYALQQYNKLLGNKVKSIVKGTSKRIESYKSDTDYISEQDIILA